MPNLFWKNDQGALTTLAATEFKTEEELETYLYKNRQLLGELIVISRQTKTGTRKDIPDLIAVDADNNVVVIELKRGAATEDVIPQVLRYAIWAETNPDSIRALWLECDQKPDNVEIDWDSLHIKIMIIAATFPASVLRLVNRITYETELVEVTRFTSGAHEFVLLSPRQPEPLPTGKIATGQRAWDEAWYRQEHNHGSVTAFMDTVRWVGDLIKERGWKLETKFNRFYVGFKFGVLNVFAVEWIGTKSFGLSFKVPREVSDSIHIDGLAPLRYEDAWKQVLYKVEGKDYPLAKLAPLFEAAYEHITGNKP